MSQRINIIVQDDIWRFLKRIPHGERSRTINQALREWAINRRRLDAIAEMDEYRDTMAADPVTSEEIVRWVRADRDGAH